MKQLPKNIEALICDFDGVFTDNRVIVMEDGTEAVICHRGDGMGIEALRKTNLPILVISKEENKVVEARCSKLKIPCLQGVQNKKAVLIQWLNENSINPDNTIYVGNDINDLECLALVGCSVAVNDAVDEVLNIADIILKKSGGHGAIRELCDMIINQNSH